MKLVSIAGIQRATVYSPNHVGNDAAIFRLRPVGSRKPAIKKICIRNRSSLVMVLKRKWQWPCFAIFNRWRNYKDFRSKGCLAINSAFGIENTRENDALADGARCLIRKVIMNTHDDVSDYIPEGESFMPCWVKGAIFMPYTVRMFLMFAHGKNLSVCFSEYALEEYSVLWLTNTWRVIWLRFYGVAGNKFLSMVLSFNENHSKFGHRSY